MCVAASSAPDATCTLLPTHGTSESILNIFASKERSTDACESTSISPRPTASTAADARATTHTSSSTSTQVTMWPDAGGGNLADMSGSPLAARFRCRPANMETIELGTLLRLIIQHSSSPPGCLPPHAA
eukprot:scaffold14489_cov117-Phaeocystis_antarctica.AAC.1